MRPERADLRPERADLRSERADLRSGRADLRPERPEGYFEVWEDLLGAHLSHSYVDQQFIHQMNLGIHLQLYRENMGEKVCL